MLSARGVAPAAASVRDDDSERERAPGALAEARASTTPERPTAYGSVAKSAFGPVWAALLATAILTAVNAIFIELRRDVPPQPLRVQALHHLYDAGHHFALGVCAALIIGAYRRARRARGHFDFVALFLGALALGALVLPDDYSNFARRTATTELLANTLVLALVTLSSAAVVSAARIATLLAKRWLWLALAAGTGFAVLNHQVLRHDYPGVHLFMTLSAGACLSGALARVPRPVAWSRRGVALACALLPACSLVSVFVWPSPIVLHELLKLDGAVATRFWARLRHQPRIGTARVPPAQRQWFTSRAQAPSIGASLPALLPRNAVLVLITVDALRADVVNSRRYDARLPMLAKLRDESVSFSLARAPSSQTMMSLGTVFAGTYFSQQYWTHHPKHPLVWPHQETRARFPELLRRHGVRTVTFSGAHWLTNEFGVVRGFQEERFVRTKAKYTLAADIVDAALPALESHGSGPLFLFLHLLDAHAPYDSAPGASDFDRYLGELALVDHQIARIQRVLATRFADRAALVIGSDHGEAFGEHGASYHATSLYEEQIRVPLLVSLAAAKPRVVNTPVSLIDLGPTILDLFGVATPGYFMGQSLTGFLRGETPTLTRPIAAEVRLIHMLIDEDGHKSVVDDRTHGSEVYDLRRDPRESRNLNDGNASAADRLALLDLFFATHRNRRPGYKLPYRP